MTKQLSEILREQADYVRNSGFTVDMNQFSDTVAIESANGEDAFFLRNDDGREFIDNVRRNYERVMDLDLETVLYANAKRYIDCL